MLLMFSLCAGCNANDENGETGEEATCRTLEEGPSCPSGYFYYTDRSCSAGGAHCYEAGDLLCHKLCSSDADCTEECRPHCSELALFAGGDYGCHAKKKICRESLEQVCPP